MEIKETPPGGAPVIVQPPMDSDGVFSAGPEGRIAETEYIHQRASETKAGPFERSVRAMIQVYREQMTPVRRADGEGEPISPLRSYVEGLDGSMHAMRMNGIDTVEARQQYEKLRKTLTQSYLKESVLKQRLNAIADGVGSASGEPLPHDVRTDAVALLDATHTEQEKLEDVYGRAISQHNEWAEGRQLFRRKTDLGPWQPERRLEPHEYDEQVVELMKRAQELEEDAAAARTADDISRIRGHIEQTRSRLWALNAAANRPPAGDASPVIGGIEGDVETVENYPAVSRERHSLEQMLYRLEDRLSRGVESEGRLEKTWISLQRSLMPYVKAYAEIRSLFELGRVTREDLEEAWKEKRGAYERIRERILTVEGLSADERKQLEQRASDIVGPDEPIPAEPATAEQEMPELELMKREDYEAKVRQIMKSVDDIVSAADSLEQQGKLTAGARRDLLDQLRVFPAELLELDQFAEDPASSRDRRDLVAMMKELRDRLEFYVDEPSPQSDEEQLPELELIPDEEPRSAEPSPTAKPVSVDDARSAYAATKTAYVAVQHRLSLDQRRDMRTRIARLAGLVRHAELAHAVAHATEHAPALAHASLASMPATPVRYEVKAIPFVPQPVPLPQKPARGLFGALGDAFKLK